MTIVKVLKDYIIGLQHVGHIVEDLDGAVAAFCRLYGVDEDSVRYVPEVHDEQTPARFAFVTVADAEFELIEPVSKELKEKLLGAPSGGAGINHVAWQVSDVNECMTLLAGQGVGPGYVTPDGPVSTGTSRIVYLEPDDCDGLFVELIEKD